MSFVLLAVGFLLIMYACVMPSGEKGVDTTALWLAGIVGVALIVFALVLA